MARSNMPREKVMEIVGKQMDEEEKMKRCNYVITNDDITAILPQVLALDKVLLAKVV
jgi:dephospho-CoA kinase